MKTQMCINQMTFWEWQTVWKADNGVKLLAGLF